jgi:serine O-acetyltransferase
MDINAAKENDPAARNKWEIFFTYSGVKALSRYRFAHFLYRIKLKFLARVVSQRAKHVTGIEIHPAAKIAPGVFIDHGSGVVIGETAEVGTGTILYQGCTLGGTGKQVGKRHPTVGEHCVISAGAKVLGDITIGDYAKVGAGAVVLRDVPPHATVVGVPARVVRIDGSKDNVDLYQEKEDPMLQEVCALRERVFALEERLKNLEGEKSQKDENIQHTDKD